MKPISTDCMLLCGDHVEFFATLFACCQLIVTIFKEWRAQQVFFSPLECRPRHTAHNVVPQQVDQLLTAVRAAALDCVGCPMVFGRGRPQRLVCGHFFRHVGRAGGALAPSHPSSVKLFPCCCSAGNGHLAPLW